MANDMLDFSKVNKDNLRYKLLYGYLRLAHNYIYYRRFIVRGKNNIPKDEGYLVIGNHQNGLNDALGILFGLHRSVVFIARADIFRKKFIAKLLSFLHIMPAYRQRDTGKENLDKNDVIFAHSARIINEGDVVGLFPEAGHQDCHNLGSFKKGFARIAFQTVEKTDFKMKLKILPVGNHYDSYTHMQNRLIINIGEPFEFTELYDLYKENPERARYLLAKKSRERVEKLMLNIEDLENYDAIDKLCSINRLIVRPRGSFLKRNFIKEYEADKKIVAKLKAHKENSPEAYDELMGKANEYDGLLKKLNLRDWVLSRKVFRWGILRTILWILFLPIWAVCAALNIVPYCASYPITRKMKDKMLVSSVYFGAGVLVLFPIWYLLLFAITWIVTKTWWIALITLALLPLTLVIFQRARILGIKLYNRIRRAVLTSKKDPDLARAVELRKELKRDISKL